MSNNFWKVTTFIQSIILSVLAGTIAEVRVIRFVPFLALKSFALFVLIVFIIQLPSLIVMMKTKTKIK